MLKSFVKIFVAAIIITTIAGCDNKSCNDVVCDYGQNCFQGQCYCADGFEGTDCSIQSTNKYIGSWQAYENCYTGIPNFSGYNCYISPSSNYVFQVEISNLFGIGMYVLANIRTDQSNQGNIIEIPTQTQGSLTVQGEGTFNSVNNNMSINFNYTYNGTTYQCTHQFQKF